MTFLNPALLWALAAISIPVLIHIFNLKRTKKVEISTLMFLKEIQQSKYKRIKLKQLLILLCRIGFITALVLMFAVPFLSGYLGSEGEKARSSVLIILDDSFSMQARDINGNNFENAKRKITETLNILDENDEVFFTTSSAINQLNRNILFRDINSLRDTLAALKISDVSKNLNEVLYFAGMILNSASNRQKEIYYFTDAQKNFMEIQTPSGNPFRESENTKVNFVLIGGRTAGNISIDTIDIVTKIFEKKKPVRLRTSVNNRNNYNTSNKSIILKAGNYIDEKVIDIPANSTVDVEFIFLPESEGFSSGMIELSRDEISDDEISGDNRQYFSIYVPEVITVLMVSASPGDAAYLELALSSSEEILKDPVLLGKKYFDIRRISAGELINANLNEYDAVVILNKPQFTGGETSQLKEYIESGGGVIIYPGSLVLTDSYNNVFLKGLNLPQIRSNFSRGEGNASKFDKVDLEHAIFDGIFKKGSEDKNFNLESPSIRSGFDISVGERSIPLITLTTGENVLVEYSIGRGKLLFFGISPDMNNSDFPGTNMFSPVAVRSILYMGNINSIKPAVTGSDYFIDPLLIRNPDNVTVDSLKLVSAETDGRIQSEYDFYIPKGSGSLLNLKDALGKSSSYSLGSGKNEILKFSANYNNLESGTTLLNPEELSAIMENRFKIKAGVIKPDETVSASILELRTGREIWHYFLILALFFLAAEYFLARSILKSK
jgi:hypothetical protein